MTSKTATRPAIRSFVAPPSFAEWRAKLVADGIAPVIAVSGSRGKSSVIRLVDAIFVRHGLTTATWTNQGVTVAARRQRGELRAWSNALAAAREGSIDVVLQELDWATVHAVGLPSGTYPIAAITNLCGNSDSCLLQTETPLALAARTAVIRSVYGEGTLVLNGEDFAVAGEDLTHHAPAILVGFNQDAPLLRHHLAAGGTAAWTAESELYLGSAADAETICAVGTLPFALGGAAAFQVHNALMAAAIAAACGIQVSTIAETLSHMSLPHGLVPGSFTAIAVAGVTTVIDRLAPPWFLRTLLRSVLHTPHRRLVTVVGRLDVVAERDVVEVGRLLGRLGGVMLFHSEAVAPERAARFRNGVAANDVPPLLVRVATERIAINRALKMIREHDLLFVLADDPAAVTRALERHLMAEPALAFALAANDD